MNRIDRRTYLALVGGATVAMAGCSGEDDEPSMDERDADESATAADDATLSDDPDPGTDSVSERAESDDQTDEAELGELLEVDPLSAVVSTLEVVEDAVIEPDDEVLGAEDGRAFAVVDVAFQHADDGVEPVIDVDETVAVELGNEDGKTYDRVDELEITALDPTASRLAPGEVVRGDLIYDVADDAEGLVLELEPEASGDSVVVDLGAESDDERVETLEQEVAEVETFSQGVDHGGIDVAVGSLEHGNNLGGFMQSDEGYEIVAVGVTVHNGSGRDRALTPEQTQLKDDTGRIYAETSGTMRTLGGLEDVTVSDGESYEGTVAYQIAEGTDDLYWIFDFTEWGETQRVFWQLR
ncbi:DUF4352 domain-containing protein [Natrarchaeobaculum sulfurireducens]|uniref:DUF4352 domain-containing protein n=1 Tax=Natrarchaeobaculum sulfurireducens TaxID=2044521 RepID=A0A346PSS4_9EURY|nr:DUF4352 domain-containing protein [Natrarchaeobaculum sulfurireducens]AXR82569.1 hypothetical protein AArcMg_2579 [Natrarchaeobaculum sulfurireducens]